VAFGDTDTDPIPLHSRDVTFLFFQNTRLLTVQNEKLLWNKGQKMSRNYSVDPSLPCVLFGDTVAIPPFPVTNNLNGGLHATRK